MSWIQGLAGKAEGLLQRMDQTAADTLQQTAGEASPSASHRSDGHRDSLSTGGRTRRSGSNASSVPDYTSSASKHLLQDETFDYTNGLSPRNVRRIASHHDIESRDKSDIRQGSAAATSRLSKQRSSFNTLEQPEMPDLLTASATPLPSTTSGSSWGHTRTSSTDTSSQSLIRQASGTTQLTEEAQRENTLLKSELQAQARELSSALARAKRAEQDSQKLMNQLSTERQKFAAENDLREQDFLNALQSKDDLLNILRARIDTAERNAKESMGQGNAERLESTRNTLELNTKTEQLNEALQKVSDLQEAYEEEKARNVVDHERTTTRLRILEEQNHQYLTSIASLERSALQEKAAVDSLRNQLAHSVKNCELAQQELVEYRRKANKILQAKDDIISSLKSGSTNGEAPAENTVTESTEVENERNMLREEVQSLAERAESLSKQWREQQNASEQTVSQLRESLLNAQAALALESERRRDLQVSINSYEDELRNTKTDFTKKELTLTQRIKDREEELQRVRAQMFSRPQTVSSDGEMETRMRVLTENLIQKQSVIDTLNSEKSSLFATVERLERRLRESRHDRQTTIRMDETAEALQNRNPRLLTENEGDMEVTRRLKRAYSAVDRFSFQLGSFLRRYPLARILVLGYMILLHFWVLVVLLTYTPEVHSHEPVKK
ncbi:hypothetical protein RvY_09432 [Ramazzottius varieornatus]|uniref:Uncharacterized protein n=1 Tax=Ramazzottius varieornatus TaxID=947166 RepID=A0A1D1VBJ3_RAMVA|nr:hypothetical protein RvY_09432 [Ramazzottius varieornatus]